MTLAFLAWAFGPGCELDQPARTVSDEGADLFTGAMREPEAVHRPIQGVGHVVQCVEQGPVEIEQHCAIKHKRHSFPTFDHSSVFYTPLRRFCQ